MLSDQVGGDRSGENIRSTNTTAACKMPWTREFIFLGVMFHSYRALEAQSVKKQSQQGGICRQV